MPRSLSEKRSATTLILLLTRSAMTVEYFEPLRAGSTPFCTEKPSPRCRAWRDPEPAPRNTASRRCRTGRAIRSADILPSLLLFHVKAVDGFLLQHGARESRAVARRTPIHSGRNGDPAGRGEPRLCNPYQ